MENSIYISAYKHDDSYYSVDLESLIVINIFKIAGSDQLRLYLKLNVEPSGGAVQVDLSGTSFEVVSTVPDSALYCSWPVVLIENYVIAGLCSVCRQIVKCSQNEDVKRLLGFRDACLMACSESSIWTKFCEIDMISTIKSLLVQSDLIKNRVLKLPRDILRFECHMSMPVRMHNVYKLAREKNKEKDIVSGVPIESLNLHHTFGEGPYLTLSDVILFCCFKIFFRLCPSEKLEDFIPLTIEWYKAVGEEQKFELEFVIDLLENSFSEVCKPEVTNQSLYIADPNRYKPEKRIYTKQKDVTNSLRLINRIDITNSLFPYGDDITFDWSKVPAEANPTGGALPEKRAYRKCEQLENLAKAVIKMVGDKRELKIVDFCSGSGHLGILLAYILPSNRVILVENKELSLIRARDRVKKLNLTNVILLQTNLDYFISTFDIGVSLHACGVATDLVIQSSIKNQANFVCCPCCYGGIHDCYHLTYPRSFQYQNLNMSHQDYLTLAHAADQTHEPNISKTTQGFVCMDAIDTDRKLYAESCGYKVYLGKLQPFSCTNKNNLLVGLYECP